VPEYTLPDGDPVHLPAVLVGAGLAASTSGARRDIDGGAVRIEMLMLTCASECITVPVSSIKAIKYFMRCFMLMYLESFN